MATFLTLTNELLRRLNEVTIDQADFASVRNVQALAKDAINSAIREILQDAQEWPFTLVTYTQTLTAGVNTYDLPADCSTLDWDSLYIKQLSSQNNLPSKLKVLTYTDYLENYRPTDETSGESGRDVPVYAFQTQDLAFGVSPVPDDAYEVEYKYWSFPADLSLFDDTTVIPDRFKHVLIDGAMMYMMSFRSNEQSASIHANKFKDGIKVMRRLLLDDNMYLKSTVKTTTSNKTIGYF